MPAWLLHVVTLAPMPRPAARLSVVANEGDAWARAALDSEASLVRAAQVGERNTQLNRSAFSLGQIVAGGALDRAVVEDVLTDSAIASGLTEREARATIASGLRGGAEQPRRPPDRQLLATGARLPTGAPAAPVTFVSWPKDWDGPGFAARSDYVERCWTSVLGPTAVLALRSINQAMDSAGGPVQLDLEDLGRSLGIGAGTGKHGVGRRTLARLEQFKMAIALPDGSMAIRTELPPLRDNQLRRAGPTAQRRHQQLCPSTAPTRALSR